MTVTHQRRSAQQGVGHPPGPADPDHLATTHRPLWLVLAVVALLLGSAQPTWAHSVLERSDPPSGGLVAPGRSHLTLWFGEPVAEAGSSFSVHRSDPSAPPVPTTSTIDGSHTVVRLTTRPLERGTYTITWAVLADDGHPAHGTVTFGAGLRPTGVATADAGSPDLAIVGLRLADLGGTLLVLGALSVTGGVLKALGTTGARLRRRILAIGALGSTAALAAVAVKPVLIGGSRGLPWLTRLVALVVAAGALWSARRESRGDAWWGRAPGGDPAARVRRPTLFAGYAVLVSVGVDAWAGHASTLPARSTLSAVAATLHVLSAGVWAGGLLVLVLCVVPLMRLDAATRRAVTPAAWRAFSPMAALSSVVLVATGVYESVRYVESLSTLGRSVYGTAVVVKILLVVVALTLAAYNTVVVNQVVADRVGRALGRGRGWRPRRSRLATTVTVESTVLVVALAVAALLTSVPTAREVGTAAAPSPIRSETVDGLFVTFEAVPAGTQLSLAVRIQPVVRPERAPVTAAEVEIAAAPSQTRAGSQGERVALTAVEPGRYEGTTTAPEGSEWTARVIVHRAGLRDSVVVVPWSAAPADTASPLELAATALSVLLIVGLAGIVLLVRRRRAAASPASPPHLGPEVGPGVPPDDARLDAAVALVQNHPLEEMSRR